MIRAILLLLAASFLGACATAPTPTGTRTARDLKDSWLESIRRQIDEQRYPEAYQEVSYLERHPAPGLSEAELEELKALITDRLTESYRQKIEGKEYGDAYRLFRSLAALGLEDRAGDWNAARLLGALAFQRAEAGDKPAAFLYALRALGLGGDAEVELLRLLLGLAAELGNDAVFQRVSGRMAELGMAIPEELAGRIVELPAMEKMVRGTVTIWVNKGIKIERGMGFPDRVIGSGFFIDPRGYLLTNYHVIASEVDPEYEGYSRLYIRPSDRVEEKIPAKVVGYDRIFDLALIKTEVTPQYVFSSGDEPDLKVGGSILAIGSPAGLENTVTSGIVSATGRRFLQMGDTIQVDVPINYGNSGGPLLDAAGRLVGVVFAGIEQFEGVNFAIPFGWVNKALPSLYAGGEAKHSWLGLAVQKTDAGLEVVYAAPESPAAKAGLQAGDILLTLNGSEYREIGAIQAALLDLDVSCLVTLSWKRAEQVQTGILALAERPFSPLEQALEKDARDNVLYPLFGMKLEKTGSFLWRSTYVVRHVLPGSVADEAGLSKDDPLTIQNWKVDKTDRYALLTMYVKKRKAGYLESAVQIAAYLETDTFI